jgi:translation initiation factor IF-3
LRSQSNANSFQRRYVTNERIQGDTFRLIDEKNEQIGVVTRAEALDYARNNEVDLILIAAHAQPQVVKAIDFHKFLYQEEKKNKESKKGQKKGGTKDVQLSLFIGEGDLERLRNKAHEFLTDGFQVRIKLLLRGRELGKIGMARELMIAFINSLEDATVAVEPKMQGKVFMAVVVRKAK